MCLILGWPIVTWWSTCPSDLHDFEDDDRLAYYYASSWFETCYTTFKLWEEILSLYDVVLENETIQIGESCVINEVGSSIHCHRHR
jgi:hypothetical protein